MNSLLNLSDTNELSVNIDVPVDKCTSTTVTASEITRTVEGTILGHPFTYSGVEVLETIIEDGACATTSSCHQGCPG